MDSFSKEEMQEALGAMDLMIRKTEAAKAKFSEGTASYTLQKNRLHALCVASSFLSQELTANANAVCYTKDDMEKALAPLTSLLSKSEKAKGKLAQGTWQHSMLSSNIKALHMALPLVTRSLGGISAAKEQPE